MKQFNNPDPVNHPLHYGGENNPYEAIKVIEAWEMNFNLGTVLKYLCRAGQKGAALVDLKKAAFYLNREIQTAQKKEDREKELVERIFGENEDHSPIRQTRKRRTHKSAKH